MSNPARSLTSLALPPLPQGLKQGVAGRWQRRIYAGLGSAGAALYRLDLDDLAAGWQDCAPFTGPQREGAASVMVAGKLYVFSGAGKAHADAATPVVLTDIHCYDTASNSWSLLPATCPVGLLGAGAWALDEGCIALIGGYNKDKFDTYLAAIDGQADPQALQAHIAGFMGMEPQDYHWNRNLWVYDIATGTWSDLGDTGAATTGAALVAEGDSLLVINGEIKPGLRSPDVRALDWQDGAPVWRKHSTLLPVAGADRPEGLAGAVAGHAQGVLLVAGGVNFPGARANAAAGRWYAHQGLTKTWRAEIYARVDGEWLVAGHLAHGLAYGAGFTLDDGLLLVGGEDAAMTARAEVTLLRWQEGAQP